VSSSDHAERVVGLGGMGVLAVSRLLRLSRLLRVDVLESVGGIIFPVH